MVNHSNVSGEPQRSVWSTTAHPVVNPPALVPVLAPDTAPDKGIYPPSPLPVFREARAHVTGQDLFDAWNEHRGPMRVCTKLSRNRLDAAFELLEHHPEYDLDYWVSVIQKMADSPFCTGKGNSGWKADFDFFLRPDTHLRVMEECYGSDGEGALAKALDFDFEDHRGSKG